MMLFMPDNKTPQTEAQTLELLNASITRETVRGAVENFLGASKEAAKQDLASPVRANICRVCGATRADGGSLSGEHARECPLRGRSMLTESLPAVTSEPPKFYTHDESASRDMNLANTQDALLLDSGAVDDLDYWKRVALRACAMVDQKTSVLNTTLDTLAARTIERDALKAREELAQTSLRLLTTALKLQNERAEKAEARTLKVEGYVRELRKGLHALRDETQLWLDDGDKYMERIDTERAKEQAQAAESRRNAAVSDADPANLKMKFTPNVPGIQCICGLVVGESHRPVAAYGVWCCPDRLTSEERRNAAVSDAGPANDVALKVTE